MPKFDCIVAALLGVVMIVLSVVMYTREASYIFMGETLDLNEIINEGGEIPRGEFVTFTVEYPLGNYAETREMIADFIPIPFAKTQQYAIFCEDCRIISAEVSKKSKIAELEQAVEDFYNDKTAAVTIVGYVAVNNREMNGYLTELTDFLFKGDPASVGVTPTDFVIDTTQTRVSQFFLYFFSLLLGGALTAIGIFRLRRCA